MSLIDGIGSVVSSFRRDGCSGNIVAIDPIHWAAHSGILFRATHKAAVSNGASLDFHVKVPAGVECHLSPIIQADGAKLDLLIYEGTTFTGDGTGVAAYCRHRGDLKNLRGGPFVQCFHTPTINVLGTGVIHRDYIGSATGNILSRSELILPVSSSYLIRVTNASAGSIDVNLGAEWYEETETGPLMWP
jgi:hypothetical protein